MEFENILFVALFLPLGIWCVVASFLSGKEINETIGDTSMSTGLSLLPIKLISALWTIGS